MIRAPRLVRFLAAAFLAPLAAFAQETTAEWKADYWDPATRMAGQLDLPLPCGGAMAFVKVLTPVAADDVLADREVRLGGADEDTGFLDYFRRDWIRGGFGEGDDAHYYIAKYEVTRDQWAAVMAPDCPSPTRGGLRPQGEISWFAAVDFTRRLSEWLAESGAESLPRRDDVPGHLRLPTEVEWEYAARGGAAVDEVDFRAPLPPMDGALTDYAWHEGRASANGAYRPVGMHRPNPLGLHGMFGGVEEITLEPFTINRWGRRHGEIGGFVTRGGSIRTDAADLTSALRAERPFFSRTDGRANALETFGLRPVISAPVNTSLSATSRIRDRWLAGPSSTAGDGADPVGTLDDLIATQTDRRMLDDLALIKSEMLADRQARAAETLRADRNLLLSGAVMLRWLGRLNGDLVQGDKLIATISGAVDGSAQDDPLRDALKAKLDKAKARVAALRQQFALATDAYLGVLIDLAERREPEVLDTQADLLASELTARGDEDLAPDVRRFADNVIRRIDLPSMSREQLVEDAR